MLHRPLPFSLAVLLWQCAIYAGLDVVLIGGGANNTGLVSSFAKRLGTDFLIPEEPVLAGALGAALIATG